MRCRRSPSETCNHPTRIHADVAKAEQTRGSCVGRRCARALKGRVNGTALGQRHERGVGSQADGGHWWGVGSQARQGAVHLSDRVVGAGVVGAPALRRGAYSRELVPRQRPVKVCGATLDKRRGLNGGGRRGLQRGGVDEQRRWERPDSTFRSHPVHIPFTASRFMVHARLMSNPRSALTALVRLRASRGVHRAQGRARARAGARLFVGNKSVQGYHPRRCVPLGPLAGPGERPRVVLREVVEDPLHRRGHATLPHQRRRVVRSVARRALALTGAARGCARLRHVHRVLGALARGLEGASGQRSAYGA